MRTRIASLGTIVGLLSALVIPLACASPHFDPGPPPAADAPASAPAVAQSAAAKDADAAEKAAKEAEERAAKHRKLERDLAISRRRFEQARMAMEQAMANSHRAQLKVTKELELAQRKLQHFQEHSAPTRVAQAELGLRGSEDGFKEAKEELAQLEMMYKDDQFADKTKEIVLERGRRRLERSQRDLEIRRRELADLKEKGLPLEMDEQAQGVAEKQRELDRLRQDEQSTRLEKEIGVMGAEAEIARLEDELAALDKEIAAAKEKREKAEKK